MRDKKLIILVALLIVLSLGHGADHIARGDIRWQFLPIGIFFAEYASIGLALYFYLKKDWTAVLGDRRGHWRGTGLAGPFQPVFVRDSTVHFPRLRHTRRRLAGGGLARRAHACPDHHRNLCGVSLGEGNTALASFFNRQARRVRAGPLRSTRRAPGNCLRQNPRRPCVR